MSDTVIRALTAVYRWFERREDRRWLPTPAGCCECGTGGPYYDGDAPQVTRYLYPGTVMLGFEGVPDAAERVGWSSCSAHPLDGVVPVVDYGRDVVRTFAETEADFAAAIAARGEG